MRLVLDTNVWLDWLVFDDPGVAPVKAAVQAGRATVCMNGACEEELVRVLAYPRARTTLDGDVQAQKLAACRRIARYVDDHLPAPTPAAALPRCRDADDQKFLELARDCAADALVTKDRALLELARRTMHAIGCRIVTPRQFAGWVCEGAPAEVPPRSTGPRAASPVCQNNGRRN